MICYISFVTYLENVDFSQRSSDLVQIQTIKNNFQQSTALIGGQNQYFNIIKRGETKTTKFKNSATLHVVKFQNLPHDFHRILYIATNIV